MIFLSEKALDVQWATVTFMGFPTLVLQTTGPMMSSRYATFEATRLEVRAVIELRKGDQSLVLFNENPNQGLMLETELRPGHQPLLEASLRGEAWILMLQFLLGDQKATASWATHSGSSFRLQDEHGAEITDRWIVRM